jgi:hypothetical protein
MLVNTRQRIAVLASGLAIATTGLVTEVPNAVAGPDPDQKNAPALSAPLQPPVVDTGYGEDEERD